jgi:hypothetical protein
VAEQFGKTDHLVQHLGTGRPGRNR